MKYVLSLVFFILTFLIPTSALAVECEGDPPSGVDKAAEIAEYINKCSQKINDLQGQQQTLKQVISTINSKINLTQAQINQTQSQINALEKEISVLSGVLETVNDSMNQLSAIYVARVRESYRRYRTNKMDIVFSSRSFGEMMEKIKYLNTLKARDQLILAELERSRLDYGQKKEDRVTKQKEVEKLKAKLLGQKKDLDSQQAEKQKILVITLNDERKFQSLLSQAKAELIAIESIIAGKGDETEVKDVSAGEVIAKVISGPSCNSGGEHLHFIVSKIITDPAPGQPNGSPQNPFSYLKSIDYENCSGSSCGSDNGDPFNPSGSWDWPLSSKIKFSQGWGETWAVRNTWVRNIYKFHNGLDFSGSNLDVKAVQPGRLFRGSYEGVSGCALKYVRVRHKEGGIDTFYLHVNYF